MVLPTAPAEAIRVFISYSRRDLNIAVRLVTALEELGFQVTIDRRDLPYGEEWLKELGEFIAGADTVVALVSPNFVQSKACRWELDQAQSGNKRLVPIVVERTPVDNLPPAIAKIQLLPAEGIFSFETHLKALAEALNTDRDWIKEHTRLADRARQWIGRNRSPALLLRGSGLTDAERWKDRRPKAAPAPSDDILELMLASRRAATGRQRVIVAASIFAAIVASGLAGAAYVQWKRAERSYGAALTNLDHLIKDLAGEMQNAQGMPVSTIDRILRNGQVLAEDLKNTGQGDRRLDASRAAMFYEFGKTYQKIGRREEAIRASNEGLAIRRRLEEADPENEAGAAALSQSLDLAGDPERENRAYDRSRTLYEESVTIETRLNARKPANADFAINLSKTLIRLGDLDRFDKSYQQAKSHYGDAFEKIEGVLRKTDGEPSKPLQRELTWNYNKRGDADTDLKNYAEAKPSYEAALCLRKHLLLEEPGNTQLKHDISWSYDKIAVVKLELLDFEGALEAQFASLSVRRKLVESDGKQVIWRRDMAAALQQIGEIKSKAADFPSALMFFIAAAEARLALKKEAPGDPAARAAFETSMTRAKDMRVAISARQIEWMERPYREVVAEEEQSAAKRAEAVYKDGEACWKEIIAMLKQGKSS
ncbi:MAG: toll/interleukin-1 receptor domain-containing protein [Rhodomicrobium sp.]